MPTSRTALPWRVAWQQALYGDSGFYRRDEGPSGHFLTSTQNDHGIVLADVITDLAERYGCVRILDLGAGRGELLRAIAALPSSKHLELLGVDVVDRPADLPEEIVWLRSEGGAAIPEQLQDLTDTLVFAHEWLDVVPCTIAELDENGTLRTVMVERNGLESLGAPVNTSEAHWAGRWWPTSAPGDRVEVGLARDDAWRDLCDRVTSGVVIGVDYGHRRAHRPAGGSLTGYLHGQQCPPIPDGSCDITAHVAVDSLTSTSVTTQREIFAHLGLSSAPVPLEMAQTDPRGYLTALSKRSVVAHLMSSDGLGGFQWVFWVPVQERPDPTPGILTM